MAAIKIPKAWEIAERNATPEDVYLDRRQFIKKLGYSGLGAWGLAAGCFNNSPEAGAQDTSGEVRRSIPSPNTPYPVARNSKYTVDRPVTTEEIAAIL